MKPVLMLFLVAAVLVSAIHVVKAQHASRQVFVEIQQLKKTRDQLNEEWRKLRLEQSTWAVDDRIESIATDKLDMLKPDSDSLVFLLP